MRRVIAVILSAIFTFLPVMGSAEIASLFKSMPSDDKVMIESFTKTVRKTDSLNLTRISSTRGSEDSKEYVIRTVLVDSNSKMEIYSQTDSTIVCEGQSNCKAVEVLTMCLQDSDSKKLSNCKVHKEKYDTERMQKEYGSVEAAIYNMFFNTGFKLNCRSTITKKEAEKQGIALETDVPSSLASIIAFPFLIASLTAPYVGNYIVPPATGITSAITDIGIGAAAKATSTIAGGVGSKIIDESDHAHGNQVTPECVIQKAENQKKTE